MPDTTMKDLLPQEWIEPLTHLGRCRWLTVEAHPNKDCIVTTVNWEQCGPLMNHPLLAAYAEMSLRNNQYEGLEMYAYSQLLAGGSKLIQPTPEQCEALIQVDANISFKDYEQPFPTILVEFPSKFRHFLTKEYGVPCPRFVLLHHDSRVPYLLMLACQRNVQTVVTLLSERQSHQSLESFLRQCSEACDACYRQAVPLKRIALNLSLLLTRYGYSENGRLDPKQYAKNKHLLKSKSRRKRLRARNHINATMQVVRISQDIAFADRVLSSESAGISDGAMKAPHWRRGHFRRQRVGSGRAKRRLVFVKPVLVNADHYSGNLSETSYTVRVGEGSPANN